MADSKLGLADFIAVALYFAAVVGAGLYVSLKFFVDLHTLVPVVVRDILERSQSKWFSPSRRGQMSQKRLKFNIYPRYVYALDLAASVI